MRPYSCAGGGPRSRASGFWPFLCVRDLAAVCVIVMKSVCVFFIYHVQLAIGVGKIALVKHATHSVKDGTLFPTQPSRKAITAPTCTFCVVLLQQSRCLFTLNRTARALTKALWTLLSLARRNVVRGRGEKFVVTLSDQKPTEITLNQTDQKSPRFPPHARALSL